MLKNLKKCYSHKKSYHSFQVLSDNVKGDLGLTPLENYDKYQIKLVISHTGN